ncbi:MAG: carbon-nitrogen hydrolase family protein [Bacteroidota bacterium]
MKNYKTRFLVLSALLVSLNSFSQKMNIGKYDETGQTISKIRVASAAVLPKKWDKAQNWERIERLVRTAATEGDAKLVVTPEGALEGYVVNEVNREEDMQKKEQMIRDFFLLAEPQDGPYVKRACALSNELDIFLVLGYLEKADEFLHNTVILIDPDGDIIGKYRKTHFAQGYTKKPSEYRAGDQYPLFQTPFGKVGMLICYDRQLPEPARILAVKGAQALLISSYGSYNDKDGWNTVLLRTRAYENKVPLVFSHPFQSLLIERNGQILGMGNSNEVIYFDMYTAPNRYEGRFRNRRPETYGELIR